MKKKGFTLIELLAVIVILAIIALIAIPIVLNMVNESRKSAAKSSALGYIESIEAYSGFREISDDTDIKGYDYDLPEMSNGKVTCTKTSSGWNNECKDFFKGVDKKAKGEKPKKATVIISEEGKVKEGTKFEYNGYEVNYDGSEAYIGKKTSNGSTATESEADKKVTITFKDGASVVKTQIVNYGSKIGTFPTPSLASGEQVYGWFKESGFLNRVYEYDSVYEDTTFYVKTIACSSFVNDSWSTIAANTTSSSYNVGCTRPISMDVDGNGSNETYNIMLVNKKECTTESSKSACGMVLQFKEVLNITNESNKRMETKGYVGGWNGSKMREYLNNTIYNKIPSDLKNVIIDTTVISGHTTYVSTNYTATDKLYLLSNKELGVTEKNRLGTEASATRGLDYYTHRGDLNKYGVDGTGPKQVWTRTVDSSELYSRFYYTEGTSTAYNALCYYYKEVAPAFRIGTN